MTNHRTQSTRRAFTALTAAALAMGLSTTANAVTYTAVLDQISDVFGLFGSSNSLSASVVPLLTADFSVDKTFTLRLEAPAGQKINVAPPADFPDFRGVGISFESGVGAFGFDPSPTTLVFENLTGPAPVATSGSFSPSTNSTAFQALAGASFTGDFSFTAVTATITVPGTYNEMFTNQAPSSLALNFFAAGGATNPGQWVTFMDLPTTGGPGVIPEPVSAALGLMGLGVLAGVVRRRAG